MAERCIKAWVSGRVQGVSFRAYTREQAQRLGIHGHAVNLADGRVEVLASGEATAVQQLIQWLHQGSPHAQVREVLVEDHPLTAVEDFHIG